MMATRKHQFQRIDRQMDQMEDLMEWMMASEAERRTQVGLAVRPRQRPRVYPGTDMEVGPPVTQVGSSGT
ncbi:hypothetical protein Hanom_Chr01g00040271 [Helianthus anomalus]